MKSERLRRKEKQAVFAMRLGVDVGTLSRWERGLHLPRLDHQVRIREVLGSPAQPLTLVAVTDGESGTLDDVNRREFLHDAAVTVAGLAAGSAIGKVEPWERLLSALRSPIRLDLSLVEAVETETAGLFLIEEHLPARRLLPVVGAHLERVTELLRGSGDETLRRRLITAAGETAALGGWLAWDMKYGQRALSWYRTAEIAGSEAGDAALRACVLGYRSYMAGGDGDRCLAVELLTHARLLVQRIPCPATSAWLAGRLAEETAMAGDPGAVRAFEEGLQAYEDASPDHERVWTRFLDRDRMVGFGVSTFARLGHAEPALQLVDGYLREGAGSSDKKRSMILADVASACLQRGEAERGVDTAREALDIAMRTECSPGLDRLLRLRPYLRRYGKVPGVGQLDEQLQAVSA